MANYLIVVPRGNTELLDLLSVAFRGHTGFNVVIDRRGAPGAVPSPSIDDAERGRVPLGPDDIVVAERADRADWPVSGEPSRSFQRIPVRRRRARRQSLGTEGSPRPGPGSGRPGTGAATVY